MQYRVAKYKTSATIKAEYSNSADRPSASVSGLTLLQDD